MTGVDFIQDLAVIMAVAGLAGWFCQRLRLSVVVGYLIAGIIVGPYTPPFPLVEDTYRIQILANVGLVFLMFSIGMGLSVRRLRRLGSPLVLATALGALLVFNGWRFIGEAAFGLDGVQSLFLAGMLVCSSSAIIGKVLQDAGFSHQKFGQLAMGVTVMEDMVAIVVLTVLISYVGVEQATVWQALGIFGAFVVVLGITGLILLPRFLGFLSKRVGSELLTLLVAAVLLGLALLAYQAGYSLALGAFVMGAIVAETAQKAQIERNFDGLLYVFSAVFFVAIGMMINVQMLREAWVLIIVIAALAILTRVLAVGFALIVTGNTTRNSIRASLTVTPLGEFSFILAQAGIAAAVVPGSFYAVAVGVSLLTALTCPILVKNSDRIAETIIRIEPKCIRIALERYQAFLTWLFTLLAENAIWQRSRRHVVQIGLGLFFLGGLILPADRLNREIASVLGEDILFRHGTDFLFWSLLVVLIVVPLTVIWHNVSALAKMVSGIFRQGRDGRSPVPMMIEHSLKFLAALALGFFVVNLLPIGIGAIWISVAILAVGLVAFLFFRQRLRRMHLHVETELAGILRAEPRRERRLPSWLNRPDEWSLNVNEYIIPDGADCAGKTIGELGLRKRFGCSIVAIDRQGFFIGNPGPQTALYPADRLLLLGNSEQIAAARKMLEAVRPRVGGSGEFADVSMETVLVPEDSPRLDRTLAQLNVSRVTGVQVAGIKREGAHRLNPGGEERLCAGDELLVLGRSDQVRKLRVWLNG